MSPPVNPLNGGSSFVPVGSGGSTPSLADQFYKNFFTADTISSGSVVAGADVAQNAPMSAVQYQASVQAAINAFITSVASATVGDVNFISSIVNNALGTVLVPDSNQIQSQYNADKVLVDNTASLVNVYDSYIQGLSAGIPTTVTQQITSAVTAINTIATASPTPSQQIAALLDKFNTDYTAKNYTTAQADIQSALDLYNNNVINPFDNLNGIVGIYNVDLSNYFGAHQVDPNYTQANWAAVQQAIDARNSNKNITDFFGNLSNLPDFIPLSSLADQINLPGIAPTDPSTFGFPSVVDDQTITSAVANSFNAMVLAANNGVATLQLQSKAVANSLDIGLVPLKTPTLPSFADYFQTVTQQIANLFTSSAFRELLAALGIQNNAASQALITLLLSLKQGSPSILLTNPSGGAVTGATLDASTNSAFVQAYAKALQAELLREVQWGETYNSPSGIRAPSSQPSDPTAAPSGITVENNSSLGSAPSNPGATSAGGVLANIPLLVSDFGALLGQYAVLAAIQVLQSDANLATEDTNTIHAEFLSALSNVLSKVSTQDLDNRITALFQSQGISLSQNDLNAINSTVTQFQNTLKGLISNTLSGQANLALATLGSQIASSFVESTFKEAQTTTVRNQRQQAEEKLSDQQIQSLLAQLPQQAYLEGPASLAGAALSGNAGPNGALGLALAGVLPKDANGNFTSVTPSQLYNSLVSLQGQAQGSATFLQLVQSESSSQLDAMTPTSNKGKAGHFEQHLQANQTATLASTANKNFALALNQKNAQFDAEASANQTLSTLLYNPSLAQYYEKKLVPGTNTLNIGGQVRKDQFLQTPVSRNTTDFPL